MHKHQERRKTRTMPAWKHKVCPLLTTIYTVFALPWQKVQVGKAMGGQGFGTLKNEKRIIK